MATDTKKLVEEAGANAAAALADALEPWATSQLGAALTVVAPHDWCAKAQCARQPAERSGQPAVPHRRVVGLECARRRDGRRQHLCCPPRQQLHHRLRRRLRLQRRRRWRCRRSWRSAIFAAAWANSILGTQRKLDLIRARFSADIFQIFAEL